MATATSFALKAASMAAGFIVSATVLDIMKSIKEKKTGC